ncbi:zinc-dependent metalloprotease [Rhodococcus gannanensis]|uniref:Zinc-dependent metalloprotease n=1 Tax=Rhodococcus gannanensis TaxID=1960308 RepID=A0ABW4PBB6_9NOCA
MTDDRTGGLGGAVDWEVAARTGVRLVRSGPRSTREEAEQVVAELADASVRAEGPVREVTGLADGLPVPQARIVDRSGWIRAASASMANLTGDDADTRTGLFGGRPAGMQAGAMLAFLSSAILGQYDPFTGTHGTLLLVAPNVVAVEKALKVSPSDFRLWVCLHEVTHRVQFSSAPWIADYMRETVATLGEIGDDSIVDLASRLTGAVQSLRQGKDQPPEERGIVGLLRATQAQPQREALDRLLMLGTLLEGHADHVMDAVGPDVVPSVARIRRAFDQRRATQSNPVQRLLRALLGVDAKMAQYVRGKAFVDAVVEQVGMDEFNAIWTGPETLPRTEEIGNPQAWIDRVLA